MSFEPQSDVHIIVIPVDAHMNSTVTEVEATLLAIPTGANFQIELLSVNFRCNTLPADGSAVTVDIEWVDDSNSDTVADLLATYDLTAATVLVNNQVWRGSQILDPGDAVNAEFTTDAALSTPSEGAALVVEYKVLTHS
jgi:hypothetical protein